MKSEILRDVICFVAKQTGVPPSRITQFTRIAEDLGVDGDDASDLLTSFASRFHVDIERFQFARHFGPEAGWSPLSALCCVFTGGCRTEPVTIAQLAEAAEKGAWSYLPDSGSTQERISTKIAR